MPPSASVCEKGPSVARIVNLTAPADEVLTLVKGDKSFNISDRIPASVMPFVLQTVTDEGAIDYTPETINRLCLIFARMIVRANPGTTIEEALDFIDVQDLPALVLSFLNPPAPSSTTEAIPTEEETSKVRIPRPKRSSAR